MDQLSPHHVPVYETPQQQRTLWEQCADHGQPVVAVRDAQRGYIVRYDLQHLDRELSRGALDVLRQRARDWQPYPTASATNAAADPLSEAEGLGGEAGPVSGSIHTPSEDAARDLASRLSAVVFDRSRWQ
ncbi:MULTISPECIES: hypothetical protein [Salinibaculum]|uniref:hypothetical protein n=1 Tax=Salinibaculum TaxID=2732368 RepID=UPI0030CF87A4